MFIKLQKKWGDYLSRQPEAGMGYQKVDVRLRDSRLLSGRLVFNAEEIDLPEDCAQDQIEDLRIHAG
jgi:hypothetical protein